MNTRAFLYLIVTTGILVFLLFIVSFSAPSTPSFQKRINFNYVRGSAIEHDGLLYTLNFEQQNVLIQAVNGAEMASLPLMPLNDLPYTKLIIYRFNSPNIEISPIAYSNDNLIFSSPEWDETKPLIEKSQGQLKLTLQNSYDS